MKSVIPFAIFWAVILFGVLLSHGYLGVRLSSVFSETTTARRWLWIFIFVHGLVIAAAPLVSMVRRGSGMRENSLLDGIPNLGFFLLGFAVTAVLLFLAWDLFQWVIHSTDSFQPDRRKFLTNWIPWGALGVAGALSVEGFRQALRGPQIIQIPIPKKDLHESLEGFKILQISDLHIGGLIRRDYVERVVNMSLSENPDLIAVTGDLVDGNPDELMYDAEPLRNLKAKYGVYFVPGNHEYYSGWTRWRERINEMGLKVLENAHIDIEVSSSNEGPGYLRVSGVSDPTAERFNEEGPRISWMAQSEKAPHFSLWLAHQPKLYRLIEKGVCDLQLSGHTHSGQFYPLAALIGIFHKYSAGLNLHASKFWVYVNRGTGFWGPPNRFGLPAEISVLTLTRSLHN